MKRSFKTLIAVACISTGAVYAADAEKAPGVFPKIIFGEQGGPLIVRFRDAPELTQDEKVRALIEKVSAKFSREAELEKDRLERSMIEFGKGVVGVRCFIAQRDLRSQEADAQAVANPAAWGSFEQ